MIWKEDLGVIVHSSPLIFVWWKDEQSHEIKFATPLRLEGLIGHYICTLERFTPAKHIIYTAIHRVN